MQQSIILPHPWHLSSCPHRPHDSQQCIFLPLTPCTLSLEEIRTAPILTYSEQATLRQTGTIPTKYRNERIVRMFPIAPAGHRLDDIPQLQPIRSYL